MSETPINRLATLGVLTGIATGLLVAALNTAIVQTERLVYGVDHLQSLDPGSQVSPLRLALTLVVVGFVTSWAWYLLNRFGRPAVSVPGAMTGKNMPLWETVCSIFIQVASVAAGAPVGRENAPRLAGGLSASWFATTFSVDPRARRILVAAAAGAGMAASFHLPLAGTLFALELLLVEMTTRAVVTTMLTSATAVAVTSIFIEPHPVFTHIAPIDEYASTITAAFVTGVIAGLIGHWFGIATRRTVAARPLGSAILWQMPAAFVVVAIIAYLVPGVSANGRWAADTIFTTELPIATLLLFIVLRMVVVLLCFRVGTVGGNLLPAFSLGATTGALVGIALNDVFPSVPVGTFAILGAGAFLSTTMAAPLFGMIAAVEFTDMPAQGYLPMFVAVTGAAIAVRAWGFITDKDQRMQPFTSAAWTGETRLRSF